MNINIHVVCRKDKINKNGTAPIHLRFTQKSKIRYISTGIVISPTLWDPNNQRIVIQDETTQDIQYRIDNILADYRKKIRRLEVLDIPVNFDTLFETNKNRHAGITIENGFKAEIERLESLGKINSAIKHKYTLQVLNGYKPITMALEAIDIDYLKGLELYLRQRGNKDNSIATRFAIFKAIYNKAVKEGKVTVKQNPFSLVSGEKFSDKGLIIKHQ